MRNNYLSKKESLSHIYNYVSISAFLVMVVSTVTKNMENCEKTIEFHPVVSLIIVLNMITMLSFNYYKKNIIQRG
jgi:hypothetical protein